MEPKVSAWFAKGYSQLRNLGGKRWLMIAGVAGIALLAFSEWLPSSATATETVLTADVYVQQTERRLTELVEHIDGAGACRVLVTLENGVEYVYATEQKTNTDRSEDSNNGSTRLTQRDDSESSVIVVDTGSGREGLLVTEIQPTVRGVVVACEGGGSEEVCRRVVQAVTVALNVSSKRVCVTKLS